MQSVKKYIKCFIFLEYNAILHYNKNKNNCFRMKDNFVCFVGWQPTTVG